MADLPNGRPGSVSAGPGQDALRVRAWDQLWRILLAPRDVGDGVAGDDAGRGERATPGTDQGGPAVRRDESGGGDE